MAAHIGAVLAEQQAVVSLLMKRLQAADYASVTAAESCAGALFSHLRVIERLVLPALSTSKNLQGAQAAARMVAAQLAAAVGEQERTGSMASYAELQVSVPLLFLAEGLLLRDASKTALPASSATLAQQAEEQFILLMGSTDFNEIRQSIADDGSAPR